MRLKVLALDWTAVLKFEHLIWLTAGVVPLVVAGPQWLTGTIVNFCFLVASSRLTGRQQLILAILPSLSAVAHGLLFGPFTVFLLYFLPFIWLGNWIFMRTFLFTQTSTTLIRIVLPAFLKASLLFLIANFYFQLHLVPKLFLTSMGIIQLATATAAGVIFFLVNKKLPNLRKTEK